MKRSILYSPGLCFHRWRTTLTLLAIVGLVTGTFGITDMLGNSDMPLALAAKPRLPCDIYAAAHTPCIAAHGTVRALLASYNGKLYQIQRQSDSKTLDIKTFTKGGYANAAPQISFCSGTTCTITKIYDQTAKHNDLPISWGGLWKGSGPNGSDTGADAMALPVTVAGHKVFGVKVTPGVGYRIDHARGAPVGSQPEGIYMVTSSNDVNNQCCFDYGSGETSHTDTGNATMNSIYWGTACWFSMFGPKTPCVGTGPWVEADLENGMYHTAKGSTTDPKNLGVHHTFVSSWLKNNGVSNFTLKYGNAQSGGLTTPWSGPLPDGYSPMKLEGSIILGTGGDNSHGGSGDFFEGAVVAGFPTNKTENAVQANIVSAGYGSHKQPPPLRSQPQQRSTSQPKSQLQEQRPCDIYATTHTPCVAAHSTVRALSASYSGKLYQIQRQSDSKPLDIKTLTKGGYANAAEQDAFCAGTSCIITIIYDQTKNHNDLAIEGPGGAGGQDRAADAAALPLKVNGRKVYGVNVASGVGYRNNSTTGIAKNGQPEGAYMVTSSKNVNGGCCFDYGNVEANSHDTGNGHMDAIYFGTLCWFKPCVGTGPWVMGDLENGLFAGGNGSNPNNKGNNSDFVTAMLKNNGQDRYALKGGDAQRGRLTTWYDGPEANLGGYSPMQQEGGIVLGTGGDNSNSSSGEFFEGAMTSGFPTNAADNSVQANIVSAGYGSNKPQPQPKQEHKQRQEHKLQLPCDIYAVAHTPCVAAHSTVRALFAAYNGKLYQVKRASDGRTRNIGLLSGYANTAAQNSFCAATTCAITIIYDQSGHGNNLAYQGPSGAGGHDTPTSATSESLTVAGKKVYSLYINLGNSYWHDGSSSGIPKGSSPQGIYMVTSGTHVNSGCCFDYGNSETDRKADTAGAMDAIYFGTSCWFGGCTGAGPWVQADLEWGLFSGGSNTWNPNQRAFSNRYVTAMLKNNGTTQMAIKGGNAQLGMLTTLYSGSLPSGYNPMKQQGAIVLGSGGDCCATNTNLSLGTFYEGAIVAGYPSNATDNAVQANIVAAGYGK